MTIDPAQYARRWKTLGVLSLSLVIIGLAAFTQAMGTSLLVAAVLAAGTAVVVARFLPTPEIAAEAPRAEPVALPLADQYE